MNTEIAKNVLSENAKVLFGIFGVIESSGYFPPRRLLNEFLSGGSDPCDQDQRMERWTPFTLNELEYEDVKRWWLSEHPDAIVDDFSVSNWSEWSVHLIHML